MKPSNDKEYSFAKWIQTAWTLLAHPLNLSHPFLWYPVLHYRQRFVQLALSTRIIQLLPLWKMHLAPISSLFVSVGPSNALSLSDPWLFGPLVVVLSHVEIHQRQPFCFSSLYAHKSVTHSSPSTWKSALEFFLIASEWLLIPYCPLMWTYIFWLVKRESTSLQPLWFPSLVSSVPGLQLPDDD